jgi:hypothetical protein
MNETRNKVNEMYASFEVGKPITEFYLAKAKTVMIDYVKENEGACYSLYCSRTRGGCSSRDPGQENVIEWSELRRHVSRNKERILECNEIKVTVLEGDTPYRGTFVIEYSKDGRISKKNEPYFWD